MNAPKVRFITRKWPPAVGGMETYSVRLTEELAKRGAVEVIALSGRPSGRGPSAATLLHFGLKTAFRLIRSPAAPIVHIADVASWPLGWIASQRHPESRIIVSAHGSDLSYAFRRGWSSALYRLYVRTGARLLKRALIVANSNYIAGRAHDVGFEQVAVVPLATDFRAESARKRRDLLFAGRITRAKGLRFLVEEVLPLLPSSFRLRVAGTVCEESERQLLSNERLDYLGSLSPMELADAFARAAAVLIPTRESEGFGLVAIEAAACGAYVVASDHSGLAEIVVDPIGRTVEANDAQAWAAAIECLLLMTDQQREEMAAAAQAEVDRFYRWPRVADATWALYA